MTADLFGRLLLVQSLLQWAVRLLMASHQTLIPSRIQIQIQLMMRGKRSWCPRSWSVVQWMRTIAVLAAVVVSQVVLP